MAIYFGSENASLYGGVSTTAAVLIESISVNGDQLPIINKNVNIEIPKSYPAAAIVEDATRKFVTEGEKEAWNNKSDFSGSYADLLDKPTIPTVPTKISEFQNDVGYITAENIPTIDLSAYATTKYVNDAINAAIKVDTATMI